MKENILNTKATKEFPVCVVYRLKINGRKGTYIGEVPIGKTAKEAIKEEIKGRPDLIIIQDNIKNVRKKIITLFSSEDLGSKKHRCITGNNGKCILCDN